MRLQPIVEGHGDEVALPVLLRRLCAGLGRNVDVLRPMRIPRGRLVKQAELSRAVTFAAKYVSHDDAILVVFDADDDCPAALAPQVRQWGANSWAGSRFGVVIANHEFEAWFMAAAASLVAAGKLLPDSSAPPDPEAIRDAKGWLGERMGRRYSAVVDQPSFAGLIDLLAARGSRSFTKLERVLEVLTRPA